MLLFSKLPELTLFLTVHHICFVLGLIFNLFQDISTQIMEYPLFQRKARENRDVEEGEMTDHSTDGELPDVCY